MSIPTLEQWQAWWRRITYEIPPWGWRSDPKCQGMTEAQFKLLRETDELPTEVPANL